MIGITPWSFQKRIINSIINDNIVALFAEQGVGKTVITAGLLERLISNNFEALLVVPLTNLQSTWVRTLSRIETPLNICTDLDEFKHAATPKVLLINYEGMARVDKYITSHRWDLVVFDESQKLKARGSKQSRIAGRIKNASRRLLLSGTPFDDLKNNPQELWAQFRAAVPELFGKRWADFDFRYLKPTGYMSYQRKFRKGAFKRVLSMIKPYCLRVTKDEVLDLPPLKYHWVKALMLGEQRELYDTFEQDMVASVNGADVSADLAITKLVRLQQICSGFVKDDDGKTHVVGRAKLRRLKRLVKRVDKPVVIFCKYLEEISHIEQEFAGIYNVETIVGKTRKTRTATLDAFQAGRIDVLIAQIRTGGVGVDLFRSHVVIFYSSTFSYIDFEQAVARVHRAGQTKPVEVYLTFSEKSIDKLIYEALLLKRSISEFVLRRLHHITQGDPIMAKTSKKKTSKAKVENEEKAPKRETSKYGISDLAEALDLSPASTRVKLRAASIEKTGGRYGWDSKAEMQAVVDQLKAEKPKAKKAKKGRKAKNDEDDEG